MRKRSATLSLDTKDRLEACLNQCWKRSRDISEEDYFAACARWWRTLTPEQQELCIAVVDEYRFAHLKAAERMAASLPAAPKYPF